MRAVMCVDLEPDERRPAPAGEACWSGADALAADDGWLRRSLGAGAPINWFVRIDPQLESVNGRATWAAERYRSWLLGRIGRGDAIGLHPHNWRWCGDDWVEDGSDDWVARVLDVAFDGFESVFGEPCAAVRYGDRFVSETTVGYFLDRPGLLVDLTLEPGTPTARALDPTERSIGVTRHVDHRCSARYQPSPDAIDLPVDEPDGSLTMVPLTTGALPGLDGIDTLYLWREPEQFEQMLALRLLDPGLGHLAFAIRSDAATYPWARERIERNLQLVAELVPDVEWCRAVDLALAPGERVAPGPGAVGSLASALVVERAAAARLSEELEESRRREAVLADQLRGVRGELEHVRVDLEHVRVDLDGVRLEVDGVRAELSQERSERELIECTVVWRARGRLLPVLRPLVAVRRRVRAAITRVLAARRGRR